MLAPLLALSAALAAPFLTTEDPADLPVALAAWDEALRHYGLSTRPNPASLLVDDHPLLPNTATLNFSGTATLGFREGRVNGTLTVARVAPGMSRVTLEFTPGPTPRDEAIQPRLVAKVLARAQHTAGEDPAMDLPMQDPLLADPERCAERIRAYQDSPFSGADRVIVANLDALPTRCRRPAASALLPTPEGREAVTAWILRGYEAAPDAEKPEWTALAFQISEPPPEIEALIEREEARQDAER